MNLYRPRPQNSLSQKYLTFVPRFMMLCVCDNCRAQNEDAMLTSDDHFTFRLCVECVEKSSWMRRATYTNSRHLREAPQELRALEGRISKTELFKLSAIVISCCEPCLEATKAIPDSADNGVLIIRLCSACKDHNRLLRL